MEEHKADRQELSHWGNDLRQSYRTLGQAAGLSEVDMHLLMNHSLPGVNAGYITRAKLMSDHLRSQQEKLSEFIPGAVVGHGRRPSAALSGWLNSDHDEVGIWCSMPAALSTVEIKPRPPKIHVHVRAQAGQSKIIDRDFDAISTLYSQELGLFDNPGISRVNITPPSAFEFVRALEAREKMDCVSCSHCGYPHLDLGDFARTPHRKHFCGNCGRDSTWSKEPIISTPLMPLHDRFAQNLRYETPDRTLDLDAYPGCSYTVWASTPANVWTAKRPQEFGIHVHVHRGQERIVDDTFAEVTLNAQALERAELVRAMIGRTII